MRFFCGVDDCLTPPVMVYYAIYECGTVTGVTTCFLHQLKAQGEIEEEIHCDCKRVLVAFDWREFTDLHPELGPPPDAPHG